MITGLRECYLPLFIHHGASGLKYIRFTSNLPRPLIKRVRRRILRGGISLDIMEAIYQRLACQPRRPRILCGDFNTPQKEFPDGRFLTWVQSKQSGLIKRINRYFEATYWDTAERHLLKWAPEHDFVDAYRSLNRYSDEIVDGHRKDSSWRKYRYDHVFASRLLTPKSAKYLHKFRRGNVNAHSALEVCFEMVDA